MPVKKPPTKSDAPEPNGPQNFLITAKEAAAMLRISDRLLWSKTKSGEIPCRYIGRAVRYVRKEVMDWFDGLPRKKH